MRKFSQFVFVLIGIISCICLNACKEKINYLDFANQDPPDKSAISGEYNLDFNEMHNYVINSIQNEYTPFFFVKEGKFDISGDNAKRNIDIKCTCMNGTTEQDVALFFSMVLNFAGSNAHEQDYRFDAPKTDSEGTYINFGTVFNYFNLKLYADDESGNVIVNYNVKPGGKIPVEPRYIKE